MSPAPERFEPASLRTFVAQVFQSVGMPATDAATVAQLMIDADLLAGTLNGAANGPDTIDFNRDSTTPTNTGQAIMAISIGAFGDVQAFKRNVDALVRAMRGSRRLPGVARIWLPGEQSHARRVAYEREGIPLAPVLVRELRQLADEVGAPPL